jgi:hypothetical protein
MFLLSICVGVLIMGGDCHLDRTRAPQSVYSWMGYRSFIPLNTLLQLHLVPPAFALCPCLHLCFLRYDFRCREHHNAHHVKLSSFVPL